MAASNSCSSFCREAAGGASDALQVAASLGFSLLEMLHTWESL
jgi:hypothetical protein